MSITRSPATGAGDADGPTLAPREMFLSPRQLIRSASWMTGSNFVAQAVAYGSLVVLARHLPPASFGTVAVGTAIVYVAIVFMDAGRYGSIVVRPQLTRAHLGRAFRHSLLMAMGLAGLMAAVSEPLARAFAGEGDAGVLTVLALGVPLYAIALVPMAVLHKMMEFRKLAQATAIANAGSALVAVVLGMAGTGVWALVARQLLLFAFVGALTYVSARPFLSGASSRLALASDRVREPSGDRWFLLFGLTLLVAMNLDYLVIGSVGDVDVLGLYTVAFMIAFAPSHHFSAEVGKVLFSAAGASSPEENGLRTVQAVRLMSMLLLPLLPAGVVLAPSVLPTVLGLEWTGMVPAFQVLLAVGIGHAIVNCIGEAMSGMGQMAFRAKVNIAWCAATFGAVLLLVRADGIRGAALAHVAVFIPYVAVYATSGARRAGTSTASLWRGIRPVVAAVGVQVAVTIAVILTVGAAGSSGTVAAWTGALTGLGAVGALLVRPHLRLRAGHA